MSKTPILFIIPGACAFGSQLTLEWLDIPYQVGITTPEIRATPAFKQINPTGKVGALKDGNTVVGENLAILLFLADKYPDNSFMPQVGTNERIKTYQWLSFLSSTLHTSFSPNFYPERFVSEDLIDSFKASSYKRLLTNLEYVNNELGNNNGFFVGNNLTIVDAQAYGLLRWTKNHKFAGNNFVDLSQFKHIEDFLNKMENMQSVKNTIAIENGNISKVINSKFDGYFEF